MSNQKMLGFTDREGQSCSIEIEPIDALNGMRVWLLYAYKSYYPSGEDCIGVFSSRNAMVRWLKENVRYHEPTDAPMDEENRWKFNGSRAEVLTAVQMPVLV